MTTETNENTLRIRLQHVLDIYGADMVRWPERDRAELAAIVETDPLAGQLVGETAALERVLDSGQVPSNANENALIDRIIETVSGHPDTDRNTGNVSAEIISIDDFRSGWVPPRPAPYGIWSAAATLAASLVLGVYLGFGGYSTTVVQSLSYSIASVSDVEAIDPDYEFEDDITLSEDLL